MIFYLVFVGMAIGLLAYLIKGIFEDDAFDEYTHALKLIRSQNPTFSEEMIQEALVLIRGIQKYKHRLFLYDPSLFEFYVKLKEFCEKNISKRLLGNRQ